MYTFHLFIYIATESYIFLFYSQEKHFQTVKSSIKKNLKKTTISTKAFNLEHYANKGTIIAIKGTTGYMCVYRRGKPNLYCFTQSIAMLNMLILLYRFSIITDCFWWQACLQTFLGVKGPL